MRYKMIKAITTYSKETFFGFFMLPGFIIGYVGLLASQGFATGKRVAEKHVNKAFELWLDEENK